MRPIATAIPRAVCQSRRGFFGCTAPSAGARRATTATATRATTQTTATHLVGKTAALKSSSPMLRMRVI
jgi:hypothetical protein